MNLSQFIGNQEAVKELKKWVESILEDPNINKRVCFLTGPVGVGKSLLAKLLFEEYHFSIRNISSSDLRIKNTRNILEQTLCFHDVLALLFEKKEFKKAVLIDNLENMGLASQEVFRTIRNLIKNKKTFGIPIIFIGNTFFKGKKPLMGNSIFIHMKPRTKPELEHLLEETLQTKRITSLSSKEKKELIHNCGGDIRRIFKYLEFQTKTLEIHEERGATASLWRILNVEQNPRTLLQVYFDTTMEGIVVPFGIHWSYLEYVPWIAEKLKKQGCEKKLWRNIAHILADYGMLLDKERESNFWDLRDLANTLVGWGTRVSLQLELEKTHDSFSEENKKSKKSKKKSIPWWVELKCGKRFGDYPVETPCLNKTLQGSLYKQQYQKMCFQMIKQGTASVYAWKPSASRYTLELLKIKSNFLNKERFIKIAFMDEID
jgi:DNA polymerase III delta prime subunit